MKQPKKRRKKPVGTAGPVYLDPEEGSARFERIAYGETKEEIEKYVMRVALESAQRAGADLWKLTDSPRQNAENDFDFTLETSDGPEDLDLMEVAPLQDVRGSYEDAAASYNHGDLAGFLWEKIDSKSIKYGSTPRSRGVHRIHLLLYTTDWRFDVVDDVLDLLAFWAFRRNHAFDSIHYYSPFDQETGQLKLVYPRTEDLFHGFSEKQKRVWSAAFLAPLPKV